LLEFRTICKFSNDSAADSSTTLPSG